MSLACKLYPKNQLGLPDMKLYKKTGDALKKAQKEVSKLKGKTKKTWEARLSSKVETPYKQCDNLHKRCKCRERTRHNE